MQALLEQTLPSARLARLDRDVASGTKSERIVESVRRGEVDILIGTQMVTKLIGKLSSHRRTKITLAVRESNLSAQLFFRSQSFKASKVLRNYYEDSGEDAFQMEYRVGLEFDDEVEAPVNRIAQYEEN